MMKRELIVIGGRKVFDSRVAKPRPAKELRPESLGMTASQPPGRAKLIVVGVGHCSIERVATAALWSSWQATHPVSFDGSPDIRREKERGYSQGAPVFRRATC